MGVGVERGGDSTLKIVDDLFADERLDQGQRCLIFGGIKRSASEDELSKLPTDVCSAPVTSSDATSSSNETAQSL